jgi:hypothetical protein
MKDSGISSQQVQYPNFPSFWKKNESLLKELERLEMPSKSRLIFKEIASNQDDDKNLLVTNYGLINIYGNRQNFFNIMAELSPDRSSVMREEIVVGTNLSDAKKTVIDGNKITNKAQIEWIKEMSKNDAHQLFRT